MRGQLRRLWIPALLLSAAFVAELQVRPIPLGIGFRIWVVGIGALAASGLIQLALAPYDRVQIDWLRFHRAPRIRAESPPGLAEWERAIDFAAWNATDFQRRLRPLLRQLAHDRLLHRRGVDADRDPLTARDLLGEQTWALLGQEPDRVAGVEAKSLDTAMIREAVVRLEAL